MNLDWAAAAVYAGMIGQIVGMVFRFTPVVANRMVPKLVFAVNFVANILLVMNKFMEAAGVNAASLDGDLGDLHFAFAAPWLAGLGKVVGAAALAYFQLMLQRLVHEKAIKVTASAGGDAGTF